MNGTVVRIFYEKGFGFVVGEDRIERFFHKSGVRAVRFDNLRDGAPVTFDLEESPKGPRACNVRPR